ncbi:MAG: hypothetical protein ACLQVM_05290 [Terriglobia bacterium]
MCIELIDSGLARLMGASEFRRYITLVRIANFLGALSFAMSLEELEVIDGVSPRSAHHVNAKLGERKLVEVDRKCNPYRYRLFLPQEWVKPVVGVQLGGVRGRVRTTQKIRAPAWKEA